MVSRSTIISVQSVETPVIKKAKLLPGAFALVSRSAAIGVEPSEQTSTMIEEFALRKILFYVGFLECV